MERRHANGRYTEKFRAHVLAWVEARGGRTGGGAGLHFGVGETTVRKWMKVAGVVAKPHSETISRETSAPETSQAPSRAKPNGLAGGRHRAPVEDLSTEDKDRAVRTVRNLARIVDLRSGMMLDDLERAEAMLKKIGGLSRMGDEDKALLRILLALNKDDAQAMLNLARAQGLIVDTHPGLMKLADVDDTTKRGRRNLTHVAEALGVNRGSGAE